MCQPRRVLQAGEKILSHRFAHGLASQKTIEMVTLPPLQTYSEEESMMREAGDIFFNCLFFFSDSCSECLVPSCVRTSNIYCLFCCLTVNKYAKEYIAPRVSQMDENSAMDKEVIQTLFEQGVCTALVMFK